MTPLRRGYAVRPPVKEYLAAMVRLGVRREEAKNYYRQMADVEIWLNESYVVIVTRDVPVDMNPQELPGLVWLSIRRQDREPVRDWRDFQQIKNQLLGVECEAVEVYPAESRLVDSANQYHLFGFTDPEARVPFGFPGRGVTDKPFPNTKQRPLEEVTA